MGKNYVIDGKQKLFLMVDTLQGSGEFGKPYFSLAMRKVPGAIAIEPTTAALADSSILRGEVAVDPISIEVDKEEINVTTVDVYTQKVQEREVNNENMQKVDVVLLIIMWNCLGIALLLAISICIVMNCRRVLSRSTKVHSM